MAGIELKELLQKPLDALEELDERLFDFSKRVDRRVRARKLDKVLDQAAVQLQRQPEQLELIYRYLNLRETNHGFQKELRKRESNLATWMGSSAWFGDSGGSRTMNDYIDINIMIRKKHPELMEVVHKIDPLVEDW